MKSDQEFKADAGKSDPTLFDEGFPLARAFIQATLDYGAIKYEAHSWRKVPNAFQRYAQAGARHRQARMIAQMRNGTMGFLAEDRESGLPHVAHELCNLMAQIELYMQSNPQLDIRKLLSFNPPPTDHKQNVPQQYFTMIPQTIGARIVDATSHNAYNDKTIGEQCD